MFAVADCELLGRQVGIATATDEVEDTEVDVSVMPDGIRRKVYVMTGNANFIGVMFMIWEVLVVIVGKNLRCLRDASVTGLHSFL